MPPTSASTGVRPAAAVNDEIRALVIGAGGWLYGETRERYIALREEWTVVTAAERGDVVTAA